MDNIADLFKQEWNKSSTDLISIKIATSQWRHWSKNWPKIDKNINKQGDQFNWFYLLEIVQISLI